MSTTGSVDSVEEQGRAARFGAAATSWMGAHRRATIALGVALVLVIVAIADWPHRATPGQRQADLQSYVTQIRNDVGSCATEVEDSLSAYNQIMAGVSTDRRTAEGIVNNAALDCTPSGNAMILDLANLQPPRSIAPLHLEVAASQLFAWASSDAVDAVQDLHALLVTPGDPSRLSSVRLLLADMQQRAAAAQAVCDRAAAALGSPPEPLNLEAVQPGVLVG